MARILSASAAISHLMLRPIQPGKEIAGRIYRMGNVTVVVAQTKRGRIIYSSEVPHGRGANDCYAGDHFRVTLDTLEALGIITKHDRGQHRAYAEAGMRKAEAHRAANAMLQHAVTLGLKLTKAQRAAVDKARGLAK